MKGRVVFQKMISQIRLIKSKSDDKVREGNKTL